MTLPPDHAAALDRVGFPVPPGGVWSDAERDLLARYGHWMAALADGSLAPVTPEQEHFLGVTRGTAEPTTPFERAWVKCRKVDAMPKVGPLDVTAHLDGLQAARTAVANAKDEYDARRQAILRPVQPELDALEAEFGPWIAAKEDAASVAEADARAAVRAHGTSVRHAGVHAVYARGRVTWDGKGLAEYVQDHPDVEVFRKVGEPSVSLRFDVPNTD